MSKQANFELFHSLGYLKPKLKQFFKAQLKRKFFLLNLLPAARDHPQEAAQDTRAGRDQGEEEQHGAGEAGQGPGRCKGSY